MHALELDLHVLELGSCNISELLLSDAKTPAFATAIRSAAAAEAASRLLLALASCSALLT